MAKKGLLVLVIVACISGVSFAQYPKNAVTVDLGPTIVGFAMASAGDTIGKLADDDGFSSKGIGLGIGAQYERHIFNNFSLALRGAFLQGGFDFSGTGTGQISGNVGSGTADVDLMFRSFSGELHARFYPFTGGFFVDGMVGYAYMGTTFDGEVNVLGGRHIEPVSFTATRNFVKVGAKVGLKLDFGRPGGFIFEPSLGYSYGIGFGDSVKKQLENEVDDRVDIEGLDDAFSIIENFIFVGGPRLSLAVGWSF